MLVARKRSHLSALIDLLNQLGRGPRANAGANHVVPRVHRSQNATAAPGDSDGLVMPILYCRHLPSLRTGTSPASKRPSRVIPQGSQRLRADSVDLAATCHARM